MQPEDLLIKHFRLNYKQKAALKKAGLETVTDLLFYFPTRYKETSSVKYIKDLQAGDYSTLFGRIKNLEAGQTLRGRIPNTKAVIADETGQISALWFHQPYLAKIFEPGSLVKVDGHISQKNNKLSMINPRIEKIKQVPELRGDSLFGRAVTGFMQPIYPEKPGLTSNWITVALKKILAQEPISRLTDPLPDPVRERYNLPHLKTALHWIHLPQKESDALTAQKRFAFQEIFFIQLQCQKQILRHSKLHSYTIKNSDLEKGFLKNLPFKLTASQDQALQQIFRDLRQDRPMSRLLEGDVGSGKTVVAAGAAYATINTPPPQKKFGRLQVAYMVPTEVLAKQQFRGFIQNFKHLPIQIGLLTSAGCQKFPSKTDPTQPTTISRRQLLNWIANGEIAIVIGTHSLIQKAVKFKNLAFVIIDEQHRFGTIQRQNLIRKDNVTPHLLSMTATPIPRTLALTIYGDLDLTVIDQLPSGRKKVKTEIVSPSNRKEMFEQIRSIIRSGRQAYVICPRIEAPDKDQELALQVASVKEEEEYLKKEIFPEFKVASLHGKMKTATKDRIMESFQSGQVDILIATSVIEVGVNIENATVMLIEGAERFGLAQLHQLRGRIQRSSHQAHCFICSDTGNEKSLKRLHTLTKAANGFELAEYDLAQRGAGELSGRRQWGVSDLAMEAIKNIKMVEAAREAAREIIEKDPELEQPDHQELNKYLDKQYIHFE